MLYLPGIVLSFFLSFVLATKKNKSHADYILIAWLGMIGLHLLTFYLSYTQQAPNYPTIVALGSPLPLAHGPFLYLYTRQQTSSAPFSKKQLLHFLLLLISYLMFTRFFFMSPTEKSEVFTHHGKGFETQLLINLVAIYASGLVYVALSLVRLLKYRRNLVHQFSNTEKINFNWLLYLIMWMVAIWIVILFVQDDRLIFGAASLFVLWIGYFSIKQVQVFGQGATSANTQASPIGEEAQSQSANLTQIEEAPAESTPGAKYQRSSLSEREAVSIHERLKKLMDEQKPFTNPDLTLNELARMLDVHPNILSQVINSKENKSFYDLVNEKRVEEFTRQISQPGSQQFTLLGLAFDCGFNSKASFNRNFKKYKGVTPSDYLKQKMQQA